MNPLAQSVLDHWLADGMALDWPSRDLNAHWFGGGEAQDLDIRQRFGQAVKEALNGGWRDWEAHPLERLALVILLDQFTRNVYRGQALAFAGDTRAQQLVLDSLQRKEDQALPRVGRVFCYMPLMHAENIGLQTRSVALFSALHGGAPEALRPALQGNLNAALLHHAIIDRHGRFPHRNAALGRTDTEDEVAFLRDGPRFGQ